MEMPDCLRHITRSLEEALGGVFWGRFAGGDLRVVAGHGGGLVWDRRERWELGRAVCSSACVRFVASCECVWWRSAMLQ